MHCSTGQIVSGERVAFLYKKGSIFGIEGNFNTKEQTVTIQFYCNKNGGEEKFKYLQSQKQSLEAKIPGIQFKQAVRRIVKTLAYPQINAWIETMDTANLQLVNKQIRDTIILFYEVFFIEHS